MTLACAQVLKIVEQLYAETSSGRMTPVRTRCVEITEVVGRPGSVQGQAERFCRCYLRYTYVRIAKHAAGSRTRRYRCAAQPPRHCIIILHHHPTHLDWVLSYVAHNIDITSLSNADGHLIKRSYRHLSISNAMQLCGSISRLLSL